MCHTILQCILYPDNVRMIKIFSYVSFAVLTVRSVIYVICRLFFLSNTSLLFRYGYACQSQCPFTFPALQDDLLVSQRYPSGKPNLISATIEFKIVPSLFKRSYVRMFNASNSFPMLALSLPEYQLFPIRGIGLRYASLHVQFDSKNSKEKKN